MCSGVISMKTNRIKDLFSVILPAAALCVVFAALFTPLPARADTGWTSYNSPTIDYPYSAHAPEKGFESGFAVNGGRILTQEEMAEAQNHIGTPAQPNYAAAYTANVHIPLDKD